MKKLWIVLTVLMFAGCVTRPVRMSPALQMAVEQSAIITAVQNKDCQAGDPNACRFGLEGANKTLQMLVDAMHGVERE